MHGKASSTPIAVIGIGCYYPGSRNPRQLWENILSRRRQFRRIPDCRLPLKDYYHKDKQREDKTYARMAAVIDGFVFDWAARRIPQSTYLATDMAHWLAFETALQAIADAGFTRNSFPGKRTGVIIGNTLTGEHTRSNSLRLRWPFVRKVFLAAARDCGVTSKEIGRIEQTLESYYKSAFPAASEDTLAGGLSNTIAGRICNYLNSDGGGYTVDGACSSSLIAVTTAAAGLYAGDLDLALAGGVDISLDPFELVGFSKTRALTAGEMNVYDRRGDGFIPGEGCGFVVLKRYPDAVRDGDAVYAVIRGWGISSDGGNAAITAPSVTGQALALTRAYKRAGYGIDSVDFIEGHGTGTAVGDKTELAAIGSLFSRDRTDPENADRCCGVTSFKSIMGHTKAASGIGGFIKAVMAVNRRVCPPTAGCERPNQVFSDDARHIYPVLMGKVLPAAEKMRAGVSAMGFGGINCHVTIESAGSPDMGLAPSLDEQTLMASSQNNEVFVLSAHEPARLLDRGRDLLAAAKGMSYGELADLAAETGRNVDPGERVRAAVTAGTPGELIDRLRKLVSVLDGRDFNPGDVHREPSGDIWIGHGVDRTRLGFLFPGQGSQQLNMARILAGRHPWARELVESADRLSGQFGTTPLSRIIFPPTDQAGDAGRLETWFQRLSKTANAQPAITLASVLWCRFLRELGIAPTAVGGHSLGELTAFHAAGAFDTRTLLRFAFARGQAMTLCQQTSGTMASFQCSRHQIESLIGQMSHGYVTLANINGPSQMVASGEKTAIDRLTQLASAEGISVRLLPVSDAFHCLLATPAANRLAETMPLSGEVSELNMRLFSSTDGREIAAGCDLKSHFVKQITAPVEFAELAASIGRCTDLLIEVGPGRVLSGLVQSADPATVPACLPVESSPLCTRDLNRLLATLHVHGVAVNWEALYANRLIHPFVPAENQSFYVNPCENISFADTVGDATVPAPAESAAASVINRFMDLPADAIENYLKDRGPFIAEVIEADLRHFPTAVSADTGNGAAPAARVQTAAGEKATNTTDAMGPGLDSLYDLVAETTGFPRETLTPESRFLDDLNLDSIKSGDLIARYAQRIGLSGNLDPAGLTNTCLGDIVDMATDLLSGRKPDVDKASALTPDRVQAVLVAHASRILGIPATDMAADALVGPDLKMGTDQLRELLRTASRVVELDPHMDLQPLLHRSIRQIAEIFVRMVGVAEARDQAPTIELPNEWVREFKVDLVEKDRPELPVWHGKRTEDQWPKAHVLILGGSPGHGVCHALKRRLISMGAKVNVQNVDAMETGALSNGLDAFSHFVAVLPEPGKGGASSEERLTEAIRRLSIAAAAPPPASHGPRRRSCLVFVQFGGGYLGTRPDAAPVDPYSACGLAKSVHLERDDLKTRVVDFDPGLDADLMAEKTIAEMAGPENFTAAGYDGRLCRRTMAMSPMDPVDYRPDSTVWTPSDVILATGGAKGITAACALAVARETGAQMALIGRTPLDGPDDGHPGAQKVREMLRQYEQAGLKARYYACDVCDGKSVARTVARIRREMGDITGVVHGAGLNMPRRIYQVSAQQALEEVSPKVLGALNLLHALEQSPPKLVVGFTSIIGVTGMPGNGWYAFSNETLDLILRRFAADHPGVRTLSVAYSIWRDEGMGARMGSVQALKQKGIDAIPTEEGVKRFVHLFGHDPGTHHVIITARLAQFDTLGMQPTRFIPGARFLEKLTHCTPGVESAFAVHLSHDEDLYLKDHCYNGSFLFPTVFGLEAMAQVVAHVTGVNGFSRLRIEDLALSRPITVDPETGADIVIWAQKQERYTDADPLCVQAGIFKRGSGTSTDYFSAKFILDRSESVWEQPIHLPANALDIRPRTDLYRETLLFQGPRFQRIETVFALERQGDESGTTVVGMTPTDAAVGQRAFASPANQHLILGDPFLRDALLQSAALLIPQDTALPTGVRRWDIYPRPETFTESGAVYARTRLESLEDKAVQTTVRCFDPAGVVHENLDGYHLKILAHHDEYPTVEDLVCPDSRDARQLREVLCRLADRYRIEIPDIDVTYLPGLHELSVDRRHALEHPLLEKAARCRTSSPDAGAGPDLQVQWQPSGKPVLRQGGGKPVDLSLAHDDRYCMVAAGNPSVGCDLAPITHRSHRQWEGLLGPLGKTLMDESTEGGALDYLGTAIWAAREVLNKVDVTETTSLEIAAKTEDSMLFRCATDRGTLRILTFRQRLTRGRERVAAVSVAEPPAHGVIDDPPQVQYPGYEGLLGRQHYEIMDSGPQGQTVFVHRFPVTFMPAGQLSRSVYFTHYFFWAGLVREASAWPVLKEISDQFKTGKWGGVTNFADLTVLGEATTQDLVEARLWATGNGGPENAVLDLCYDFRKVLPDGGYERLAWLEQQTTWVRILDHGVVKVEPYPAYYADFVNAMLPRHPAPNLPEPIPEPLAALGRSGSEPTLYSAPAGPSVNPILRRQQMETSLEDANIVGNIYFANYYAWQGRVRDRYFYQLIPEYFQGTGASGELVCLNCRVDHLREAMPFDTIEVQMALKTLSPCHATLYFEYFKSDADGNRLKLGTGYQDVVWVRREPGKGPVPEPFPNAVHEALRQAIDARHPFRQVVNF